MWIQKAATHIREEFHNPTHFFDVPHTHRLQAVGYNIIVNKHVWLILLCCPYCFLCKGQRGAVNSTGKWRGVHWVHCLGIVLLVYSGWNLKMHTYTQTHPTPYAPFLPSPRECSVRRDASALIRFRGCRRRGGDLRPVKSLESLLLSSSSVVVGSEGDSGSPGGQ